MLGGVGSVPLIAKEVSGFFVSVGFWSEVL